MKAQTKVYLTFLISFLFLLIPLILSYQNIETNNKMLKYLSHDQISFNYLSHKLNYDIKKNQSNILQVLVLDNTDRVKIDKSYAEEINDDVVKLDKFVSKHPKRSLHFKETLSKIKKRVRAYALVQKSLFDALELKDTLDIEDALIGFNAITVTFSKDTQTLIDYANAQLYRDILTIEENNNHSRKILIFSFLIAFLLILYAIYTFSGLNSRLKLQLKRTKNAEKDLKNAQSQLLKYNDDLEEEIARKSKELHDKIYTSFLSGLPNRNKLLEDIKTYQFSKMAILNIDKFQSFNDIYGEEIGNVALGLTAEFLKEQIKDDDLLLYHIGGDEFCIVCTNLNNNQNITNIFIQSIEKILKNYKAEHFYYEGKSFQFLMSAGISYSGNKKMLAYTDMALKDAKKRNIQLSIFNEDKELEKIHQEDIECHKKLLSAFKREALLSFFQPILPIQDSSRATKYESLIRLEDENGKIIPPFNFLNVAKANRVYYKITRAVIQNTLKVISEHKIPCSINISLSDINNDLTMKYFFDILNNYDYNNLLTVELLETEDFDNYEIVYDFCMKVRSFGIKIALDDFGSGYANFSHILNLPVDYIKIDASLISDIDRNQNSRIMVETIVDLAKKLHVETIAEFVSSEEILKVVTELGVDYAQGYFIGKPEPITKHLERLKD